MRVLVAMSGGVDSSVAALLLVQAGHDVVGATMKLWGGSSDSGCCSVADVIDARRVADRVGIEHHVFNFTDDFEDHVVTPYVRAHEHGETPNPCVECNRHLKFGAFATRARRLGFDAIATGHHARVLRGSDGSAQLVRGADRAKDQSYVLSVLGPEELDVLLLPIGELHKDAVRKLAADVGLSVAAKPDSQDVCFIASRTKGEGREAFLRERIELHPGKVTDASGNVLGEVAGVELVTIGQRRGLKTSASERRYVLDVDIASRTVLVGTREELTIGELTLRERTWVGAPGEPGSTVEVQSSAHGQPVEALLGEEGISFSSPQQRVAPGQIVALYDGERVLGSGIAC